MKKTLLILLMMGSVVISSTSFAWIETAPQQKSYNFKYKLKTDSFEYSRKAASYEEALDSAAQACFNHFKAGRRLTENQGLDIIDVCVNPRI
jgi:hypothetical protein